MSRALLGGSGHRRGLTPPPPPPPPPDPDYWEGWDLRTLSTSHSPPPNLVGRDADFDSVGIPPGTPTLVRQTGTTVPTSAGQILYGLDLDDLDFAAGGKDNVIAVACRIRGMVSGRPTCHIWGCEWGRRAPGDVTRNGFRYTLASVRRTNWYGFTDDAQVNNTSGQDFLVRDSLLHDLSTVTDTSQTSGMSHNDVFQVIMGGNLSIVHNNIKAWGFYAKIGETIPGTAAGPNWAANAGPSTDLNDGYINSVLILNNVDGAGNLLNIHDILVEDNLIDGNVAAIAHLAWPQYDVFRVVIKGNRIVRKCWAGVAPISGPKGTAWTDGGVPNNYVGGGLAF